MGGNFFSQPYRTTRKFFTGDSGRRHSPPPQSWAISSAAKAAVAAKAEQDARALAAAAELRAGNEAASRARAAEAHEIAARARREADTRHAIEMAEQRRRQDQAVGIGRVKQLDGDLRHPVDPRCFTDRRRARTCDSTGRRTGTAARSGDGSTH